MSLFFCFVFKGGLFCVGLLFVGVADCVFAACVDCLLRCVLSWFVLCCFVLTLFKLVFKALFVIMVMFQMCVVWFVLFVCLVARCCCLFFVLHCIGVV